ncbi:MAG: cation:proton antiporter [Muribaculaceae bacterium]|nr:cation:proton antiporter [Muribaculaceae bacterium]
MKTLTDIFTFPLTNPVAIFLLVMSVILFAPLLFRRIKVPNIVGLIIAGVIIGPYGFNILARDASFEIFGQVGILYLMFLAAIEIDMYHLRRNYKHGVFFGLLTFLLPMAIGVPVTRLLLNTSWATAVLVSSMYASHTLVSYPIVSRFGLSNNRAVIISVCGTIVAVLLALLALAEVIDVHLTGHFGAVSLLKLLLLTVIYAIGIAFLFPFLTRRFFRSVNDSVAQFVFIMVLMLASSLLARLIGLEAILGAFYGGLVLNRFIPVRSQLMRHISFVGNALFIPYFLIGVGMLINVHLIFAGWGVARVALVMTLTALVSKWLATWITQHVSGLGVNERRLMFGLSSGKAAATIAATMIGFQYGLMTEDMMNGAVVMILICCIVASLQTERASIRIRMRLTARELEREPVQHTGFARQVVAVANPVTAESIMRMALYMRSPLNTEAVTALYVRNADAGKSVVMGREALGISRGVAEAMEIPCRDIERFDLNIGAGITNLMREWNSTEVIIGLHRRSKIADNFYGSMIEQLMGSTDRMIIMSRCFMPIDTIRKLVVIVPRNAEYETGFGMWVARIGNLAAAFGVKTIFICYPKTAEYLEGMISEGGYAFTRRYRIMESWDDFIILSSQIDVEDLMIVVGARKGSISCTSDLENMPGFLGKHFSGYNIAMIIPAQFGEGNEKA